MRSNRRKGRSVASNARAEPDALELMRIQVETLFTHDDAGRMLRVNEANGARAPRFFIGRTTLGDVLRFRDDVDVGQTRELERAAADKRASSEDDAARYEAILARHAPIERKWSGPAFRFPLSIPETHEVVRIAEGDADLLRLHFESWISDVTAVQPMLAVIVDGRAVSLCSSVRTTPRADECGVETAAEWRGRGLAARAVLAWASAVRALGRIPLYSTSWSNAASRALAKKLGLEMFGSDLHIT